MSNLTNESIGSLIVRRLVSVKSFVTVGLTLAFIVMCIMHIKPPDLFIPIYTTVIGFYFGTQTTKDGK